MVTNLRYRKAVVIGTAKKDVESVLNQALGFGKVIITPDQVMKGKPHAAWLFSAEGKLKLGTTESIVVENAPLGVEVVNKADIPCIVVFNNTPLDAEDFKSLITEQRILKCTESAFNFLQAWCN
ncbi:MAG: hypothetical protein WA667_25210 [Candidatus Nitrosopolaris sp.]